MSTHRGWNPAHRPASRVALGFTLGGIIGFSLWAVDMSRPGFVLPAVGLFLSGLIGGVSLYPLLDGWLQTLRAGVGFGLGFLVMSAVLLFTLLPIQGMSGTALVPAVFLVVGFTAAFGVAGAIGGAFLGLGGGIFLRIAGSFAEGGAAGGVLLALVFAAVVRGGSLGIGWTRGKVVVLALAMACFLVSYAVGGALFGRALGRCQTAPPTLPSGVNKSS